MAVPLKVWNERPYDIRYIKVSVLIGLDSSYKLYIGQPPYKTVFGKCHIKPRLWQRYDGFTRRLDVYRLEGGWVEGVGWEGGRVGGGVEWEGFVWEGVGWVGERGRVGGGRVGGGSGGGSGGREVGWKGSVVGGIEV